MWRLKLCVRSNEEKLGGNRLPDCLLEQFLSEILHCQLLDLKATGHYMSWSNQSHGLQPIMGRLDRALVRLDESLSKFLCGLLKCWP